MRRALAGLLASFVLFFALSCGKHDDANSAAGKLGQAAHKLANHADKAARSMGKDLKRAAHDAREGWKEEDRKSHAQGK